MLLCQHRVIGHNCRSALKCHSCKGKHHRSICFSESLKCYQWNIQGVVIKLSCINSSVYDRFGIVVSKLSCTIAHSTACGGTGLLSANSVALIHQFTSGGGNQIESRNLAFHCLCCWLYPTKSVLLRTTLVSIYNPKQPQRRLIGG